MHSSGVCGSPELLSGYGRLPSSPSSAAIPRHCSHTSSVSTGSHHLVSLESYCSQTMLKSLQPLWPISVTVQLSRNKPTRFQTDLSHRAGLPNECLHHMYPQQVRTKGSLEAHKTLPSSHRHLTFDLNSLSWDSYDCSLREKPSIRSL